MLNIIFIMYIDLLLNKKLVFPFKIKTAKKILRQMFTQTHEKISFKTIVDRSNHSMNIKQII